MRHWAWTIPLYQSWEAALTADPKLGGKHAESWSSFSSQDPIFEGLIIPPQLLAAFIPARFHQQLHLPQAAHTPRSPAGPEKQNLDRKLGQRWVLPQYRTVLTSIWLKTDLAGVKSLAYLDCSKEENSSSDIYIYGHEEESKPFDFLTSGSGSDSLINCPRSLTRPKVIFLKGGRVKGELQH